LRERIHRKFLSALVLRAFDEHGSVARRSRMPRCPWQRDPRAAQVVATLTKLQLKGDVSLTTRHAAEHYHQLRQMTKRDEYAEVAAPMS
jgi:hypothetical protein